MTDTPEIAPDDPIHKRNFLLMISPAEGQKMSEMVGFSSPSSDVAEAETFDVLANWIVLASSGVMKNINNASSWLTEVMEANFSLPEDAIKSMREDYFTFGVALISYLIQIGSIDVYSNGEASTNIEDFIKFLPTSTMLSVEEYKEDE